MLPAAALQQRKREPVPLAPQVPASTIAQRMLAAKAGLGDQKTAAAREVAGEMVGRKLAVSDVGGQRSFVTLPVIEMLARNLRLGGLRRGLFHRPIRFAT